MVVLKKEANLPSSLEDTALNTPTHTLPPTTTHRRKPNACILEDKKISMYQTVASTSDHRASPIQAWAHDSDTNHTVSQTNIDLSKVMYQRRLVDSTHCFELYPPSLGA